MTPARSLLTSAAPAVWLFVGDSITQGALHTFGWRDYTQLFAERVRFELGRAMDIVVNIAVSGATSADALNHLGRALEKIRPDAAFIMLGVNDASADRPISPADLKANLKKMLGMLSARGCGATLQTSSLLLPSAEPYREKYPGMMEAVREVSREEGLPLIDHEACWKSYEAGRADRSLDSLMCDPVHPNAYGHALLAQHLLSELGIFDPQSPTGRSFIP